MPAFGSAFAQAYAWHWTYHAAQLVRDFPGIVSRLGIDADNLGAGSVADVACGEGTFAVGMAAQGRRVYGIDQSPDMLAAARERARARKVDVTWLRQDMRRLELPERVDLVTCWFNSLNYLPSLADWSLAFDAARGALAPGGWLLLDAYTPYGLRKEWADGEWLAVDTNDCIVVSRTKHDRASATAEVHFTGFVRDGATYVRFDERHRNRAYEWKTTSALLGDAGFVVRKTFVMPGMRAPGRQAIRLYVAAEAVE